MHNTNIQKSKKVMQLLDEKGIKYKLKVRGLPGENRSDLEYYFRIPFKARYSPKTTNLHLKATNNAVDASITANPGFESLEKQLKAFGFEKDHENEYRQQAGVEKTLSRLVNDLQLIQHITQQQPYPYQDAQKELISNPIPNDTQVREYGEHTKTLVNSRLATLRLLNQPTYSN